MNGKVRFGIVGAGAIASAYAKAFQGSKLARIVAVADIRPECAQALAERIGCAGFGSHREMALGAELDAVIVCTPPATHAAIALHFLSRGVHVLCEKPLSVDLQSAATMLDAAQKKGVILTMASKFRYVDDVVRAKDIAESGILGDLVLVENVFASRVDMSTRWNSDPKVSGGGVLIDNGTHSVDIMRYFLGALADVQVMEGKRIQGLPVEDTVRMFVRSQNSVLGSIDLSWSINKQQDSYISLHGPHGTVLVGWKESKYRLSSLSDWIVFGNGYDKAQALRRQIDNFAKAVLGEERLLITAEDALASVQVIAAAYAALRRSAWTRVDVPPLAELGDERSVAPAISSA